MELISIPGLGPNPANVNGCIMEQCVQIFYLQHSANTCSVEARVISVKKKIQGVCC